MRQITCIAIAWLALSTTGCATDTQPDNTFAQRLDQLERSAIDRERDAAERPAEVLSYLGIGPGNRVADLFAGGGYYSELLAAAVGPEGKVIAYNNSPYAQFAGTEPSERFGDNRHPNVDYVVAEVEEITLPTDLDAAIMVMSFHDLYWVDAARGWPGLDAKEFMQTVFNSLKSGGTLGIIDHHAAAGSGIEAVAPLHRIDKTFVIQELQAVGFELAGESDLLRNTLDDRSKLVFDPDIRRKTDRFLLRFVKP